jgi:thiamine-phosphate pyrophosphorylase
VNEIPSPLLVVTDRHQARWPLERIVAEVVAAGARWIWFRDRDLEIKERRRLALRLSDIVQAAGGRLSIGDDTELAAEIGTRAVHLRDLAAIARARQRLGPTALVGLSAHSVADVAGAHAAGADYVTLSPIYQTASKPGYGPPLGSEAIEGAALINIPVLALGGVAAHNCVAVMGAGASGVAIMGGIMRASRPGDIIVEAHRRLSPCSTRVAVGGQFPLSRVS